MPWPTLQAGVPPVVGGDGDAVRDVTDYLQPLALSDSVTKCHIEEFLTIMAF